MLFQFPITEMTFQSLVKMGLDDGIVGFGAVQAIERAGKTYYAIRDGGFWSHPGLKPYIGQAVAVNFNTAARRLEVELTEVVVVLEQENIAEA